ncbi:MAG: GTPase domain-containing protein [Verrucomicrobiales bacterium]|jgi:signal recognition particle receptor subunit beta|nr:GTPase domain-containing protein [Verrucomicrobiales bacterium]MBP9222806.1 GTPase domain-containing protein [Verrucomicrobiales bacterium]
MALIRHDSREIQFKIVYCGPPEGGKTSNLQYIHRRLDAHYRGDLVSISTGQNRTICFDFLPVHAMEVAGYQTRFQLYTVPGQEVLADTRQTVLAGADGVVFVADSSPGRREANLAAYRGYRDSMVRNHVPPDSIPVVYQYNKRDCPGAIRPEELDEAFQVKGPSFLACATSGYQVFATLDHLTGRILQRFHATLRRNSRTEKVSDISERSLVFEAVN